MKADHDYEVSLHKDVDNANAEGIDMNQGTATVKDFGSDVPDGTIVVFTLDHHAQFVLGYDGDTSTNIINPQKAQIKTKGSKATAYFVDYTGEKVTLTAKTQDGSAQDQKQFSFTPPTPPK